MEPNIYHSIIPLLAVLVSLAAAVLILASGKRPNLREFFSIAAAAIKFGLILSLVPAALKSKIAFTYLFEIFPGIPLALKVDGLGLFFALVSSSLWIVTTFYSIGYMRGHHEHKQTRYFASFAVCLSAAIGIAFSANLLTFIIFYEILTIATYPLVIHKESKEAISAGRKYLAYTLTAGLFLIAATFLTHNYASNIDFVAGGIPALSQISDSSLRLLFILFILGVGVKAGIMPLHSWLPTAMIAPTPVSALLHAVAVVKAGAFGILRVCGFVFGPKLMGRAGLNTILLTLAGITILVASLIALNQNNLKRRLAYSTVGHLSYIVLGAALLNEPGYLGGVLHLATHATMKITLFFCAGAIFVNLHKENVSELNGIGRAMPWTMSAFAIGAFGLAGIPPINGFLSKFYLAGGTIAAEKYLLFGVLILSGLLNIYYLFEVVYRAFFKDAEGELKKSEASFMMVGPLAFTAFLSVIFGLFPDLLFRFFSFAFLITQEVFKGF